MKLLASVALLATMVVPSARAGSLYVFGDSLSDNGNLNRLLPGSVGPQGSSPTDSDGGRFSNGPVWAEDLPAMTGLNFLPRNDYAYGGAFTGPMQVGPITESNLAGPEAPGVSEEIAQFAAGGGSFAPSDVVTLWAGANNYFGALGSAGLGALSAVADGGLSAYAGQVAKTYANDVVQDNNAAAADMAAANNATAEAAASSGWVAAGYTAEAAADTAAAQQQTAAAQKAEQYETVLQGAAQSLGSQAISQAADIVPNLAGDISTTLIQLGQDTNSLINLGARMLIVPNLPNLGLTPAFNTNPALEAVGNALSSAHDAALPGIMQSLHETTGANIIVLNVQALLNNAVANPAEYGLTNVTGYCAGTASCQGYLFWNDVHPTTYAQSIIGAYAARSLIGFESLTVPAQLGTDAAQSFTNVMNGRLDALQNGASGISYGLDGINGGTAAPDQKLSLFLTVGGQFGTQHTDSDNFALGYSYNTVVTAMGADYRWNDHVVTGLAVGYNDSHADVKDGGGKVQDQGVDAGLYALLTQGEAYAKVTGGFDKDDYKTSRAGVIEGITGKPDGQTWSASTTMGLNFQPSQTVVLGPNVGLAYTNSGLGDYTETGDSLLTQHVDSQNVQQLIASTGLHTSTIYEVNGIGLAPYASASAQYRLSEQSHHFSSYFTDMPGVTLTSTPPTVPGIWALFSAGLNANLGRRLNANLNVATTAFKSNGNAVQINGNLAWKF